MKRLDSLEESLGVEFQDRDLLRLAFIHSSYLNENPETYPESNERLEYLGDAQVGLVIAHDLFERYPDQPEGELTALRSELVRGETLARIAESLHLGQYLLMGKGEEANGGRERQSNLAATFESLVGALFLDQGYEATRDFVLRVLSEEITSVEMRSNTPKNPKSTLQEMVQRRGGPSPSYRIVEVSGEDHAREFTAEVLVRGEVKGRGTGHRKSLAERAAAQKALEALG